MTDPKMIKREGILHLGYSLYIWIFLFYTYENFISAILTADLGGSGLIEHPTMADLYKRVLISFLVVVVMILIAHCAERFLRSNLFFPLMNLLLSGTSIILLFDHFFFASGFSNSAETVIAANTFMIFRLLLLVDSIILLKKYFRAKKRTK